MPKLDRLQERRARSAGKKLPEQRVPSSSGPDEETVRLATKDFRRRRRRMARRGWRRRVLVALVLLLVAGLVAGGVWLMFFSPYVTARSAEVTGNTSISTARIDRVAAVPVGTPLVRVDLDAIRRRVEAIPAVRSVDVSRAWPHRVHIAVTERVPIAVIDRGNGLQALDADGVMFGSYAKRPRGLPLVRTEPATPQEALVEGGKVIASLPASVASRVATINVESIDQISLDLRNGRRVEWGSAEDSQQKAEVLAVMLPRSGQTIDVSVPGRPTTR
ncbi:MAG: FtsQ-type POTRA domain-containing protein [Marmoricola sp.]|nr:FtsQ-type POTRA domain-containing protein [Marmoricola sp.]